MHPSKVDRNKVTRLTDLPNIGKVCACALNLLGIHDPHDLIGCDPYEMHERYSQITGISQDPCFLDTLISVTRFMQGEPARPWWHYTTERKAKLRERIK